MGIIFFLLGLALGSFTGVLASRYDPDHFIFNHNTLGGRSHCPHCKKILAWYELVPLVSFFIQRGRCRGCGSRIALDHLWAELLGAAIVCSVFLNTDSFSVFWTTVFFALLLVGLIDARLQMIPDELNIFLAILGGCMAWVNGSLWTNVISAAAAAGFFAMLVVVTRGRGMGWGDVKLAFALGLLFGWPNILVLSALAFIIGAVWGVGLILLGQKKMKSALPFGPFLALAAFIAFLFGNNIVAVLFGLGIL